MRINRKKKLFVLGLISIALIGIVGCSSSNSKEGQKTLPGDYEGPPGGAKTPPGAPK
jgi:hypothetical protein